MNARRSRELIAVTTYVCLGVLALGFALYVIAKLLGDRS